MRLNPSAKKRPTRVENIDELDPRLKLGKCLRSRRDANNPTCGESLAKPHGMKLKIVIRMTALLAFAIAMQSSLRESLELSLASTSEVKIVNELELLPNSPLEPRLEYDFLGLDIFNMDILSNPETAEETVAPAL